MYCCALCNDLLISCRKSVSCFLARFHSFPLFLALCVAGSQPPSARTPSLVCWTYARTRPEGVMPHELVRALESDSRGLPLDVQAKRRIEGKTHGVRGERKRDSRWRFRLSFPVEAVCPREVRASRGF